MNGKGAAQGGGDDEARGGGLHGDAMGLDVAQEADGEVDFEAAVKVEELVEEIISVHVLMPTGWE